MLDRWARREVCLKQGNRPRDALSGGRRAKVENCPPIVCFSRLGRRWVRVGVLLEQRICLPDLTRVCELACAIQGWLPLTVGRILKKARRVDAHAGGRRDQGDAQDGAKHSTADA